VTDARDELGFADESPKSRASSVSTSKLEHDLSVQDAVVRQVHCRRGPTAERLGQLVALGYRRDRDDLGALADEARVAKHLGHELSTARAFIQVTLDDIFLTATRSGQSFENRGLVQAP
jgi:hypothetical protein